MKHYIYILLTMIAIPTVTFAQKVDGRKVRGHVRDGNKAYEQKLYGKAQESFEDALLIDKIDKTAIYNLANTYYKERMWDEAIAKYQEFLSLESKDQKAISEAWHNMGNALLQKEGEKSKAPMSQQQGQQEKVDFLKESIEAYKNALRFNPEDDEARYNLAVAQRMVKDQDGDGGGGDDKNKDNQQNQDQNKDKDKDKGDEKDKNKDQNKGQDKDQQKQDNQDQQEGGMSKQNMEQLLKALEQDEKDTQRRVNAQRAKERQKQNMQNRELDKDW